MDNANIKIYVKARNTEYVKLGFFVPKDYRGDTTEMRYGIIGFGESPEDECKLVRPEAGKVYPVNLPALDTEWKPQLKLTVKVEGDEMYVKYIYLGGIDWSKDPAFTLVVSKYSERTGIQKEVA